MVSLFTMFVARGVEMPAVDPRLQAQSTTVVPSDQQSGPVEQPASSTDQSTPVAQSGQ